MTNDRPRLFHFILVPLLYYVAAKIGIALTVMPEGTAIVWPPNGFLLAALLRFRRRGYFVFAGLTILTEVITDVPRFSVVEAILFGVANVGEVTIAAALLARWRFNPRFVAVADLLKFVVAGPIVGAFLAAWLGAITYEGFRGTESGLLEFMRIWWLGDAVGLMIVTPLVLSFWTAPTPQQAALAHRTARWTDALVGVTAIAAVALLFATRDGMLADLHVGPILLLPIVIYAAARFGVPAATVAAASVALVVMGLTTRGYSPFGAVTSRAAAIQAQEFIFISSLIALGLAALLEQLRASQYEVATLNAGLERRVHERTAELESALAQVKRLQGLLPICAWCKKVRDDEHYWLSVEEYIVRYTDARFSHGICPECSARLLREAAEQPA